MRAISTQTTRRQFAMGRLVASLLVMGLLVFCGAAWGENVSAAAEPVGEHSVLVINVHGTSYDAHGHSVYDTVAAAGATATYLDLSGNGQAAALIQANSYDQIWVFDLSDGADNYPADWAAIADWFNADPTRAIVCDARMISSYWNNLWQTEGMKLSQNYYENMKLHGGGLLLGTDHSAYHPGINSINSQIGIQPFVGEFNILWIPVDVTSPLMTYPNNMGAQLHDNSSPGQTPYGGQPNGRILYTVAWHSNNPDTPGISTTIEGGIGFHVDITSPATGSQFFESEIISFAVTQTGGDEPVTYNWSSDIDGAIGSGATLDVTTLSPERHIITVLAEDNASRDDDDQITVTILPLPQLTIDPDTPDGDNGWYTAAPTVTISATVPVQELSLIHI